jgi:hypothetical protein
MAPWLEVGFVVAVYPQGHSVDVLLPNTGSRLTNVQALMPFGSDQTGEFYLPDPGLAPDDSRWNLPPQNLVRMLRAVIATYRGSPICLGFLPPQIGQMDFDIPGFYVKRHQSDVYQTITDGGDYEFYHPSGTYFRISESTAHDDLTGQDYDGNWKIARNTGTSPHVHFVLASAGVVKGTLDIDPSGNVTGTGMTFNLNGVGIDAAGNITTTGNITGATVTGNTEVVAKTGGAAVHLSTHNHPADGDPPTPGS